ncbi:MAG: diguanylate cyclase [Desulfatibacillum sp.]|nr:diguanylate cyclase [Desulfatibacillum sp.]
MERVLLVEDSQFFGTAVKERIESEFKCQVYWATSMAETEALFNQHGDNFAIGVLDYTLPDAREGEIIEFVLSRNIPSIVFSAIFSDDARDFIWSHKVVDYVLKKRPESINYVLSLIKHILRARETKILVVDDSRLYRQTVVDLLKVRHYDIYEATNGKEALQVLAEHPDIRMVITDYYMPEMDGIQLTNEIRRTHGRDSLAIIGISSEGGGIVSAQFIKSGATDFLNKPFLTEEFYCRVTQSLDLLRYIRKFKNLSTRDFLTALYNRRYFFDLGHKFYAAAIREKKAVMVATIDIDHFKKVNDTYGHDAGDQVIKVVANTLAASFRETDIVARFGGEEFCVFAANIQPDDAAKLLERIRRIIGNSKVNVGDNSIQVTVSIGACIDTHKSLEEMIIRSDQMLYAAKDQGRNRVLIV